MTINETVAAGVEKVSKLFKTDRLPDESTTDVFEFLEGQHREVEALFDEFEASSKGALKTRINIANQIVEKLKIHSALEETYLYPAAKVVNKDLTLEAIEEHWNIHNMLVRITKAKSNQEALEAKLMTLKEAFTHHISEEENQLFPECKREIDPKKLDKIGKLMQEKMNESDHKGTHKKLKSVREAM